MNGFERKFLGQVQLVSGPSTTPFYAYPPYGYFANPSGNPLMTEELTSPQSEHIAREFHCYRAPDGSFVSVPFAQADAAKAAGYEAVDYSNCGAPPHAQPVGTGSFMMGRKREENMLEKRAFLGEVRLRGMGQTQMRAGTGFTGPFGIYSDMPHPVGNAPAGFPTATVEEIQTYVCPDGTHQNMTRQEAAREGCVLAPATGPYAVSAEPSAYMMGQPASSGPSSPGTGAAPAGTPAGQAIAQAGQPQFTQPFFPNVFPNVFPGYYPPPPAASRMTCKRHVDPDTGEETFDCEPVAPVAPVTSYRYPVYFVNPFFF